MTKELDQEISLIIEDIENTKLRIKIGDGIKNLIRQICERVIDKHIKDIEKWEMPMGFGSASGSMTKSAMLKYLKSEKERLEEELKC